MVDNDNNATVVTGGLDVWPYTRAEIATVRPLGFVYHLAKDDAHKIGTDLADRYLSSFRGFIVDPAHETRLCQRSRRSTTRPRETPDIFGL